MRIAIILSGACLLAACGQSGGGNDAGGNAAGAANGTASAGTAPAGGGGGSASAGSAMQQMQPGEWEISMQLPNGGALPGTRVCLTPEDVSRGAAAMAGGGRQQEGINCDYSGVSIAGGRISGTSSCTQPGGMSVSITMDGTMTPTEYAVNQRMRTTINGQTRETEARITGRRIGECQAGQP